MVWSKWVRRVVRAILALAVRLFGTLILAGFVIGMTGVSWRIAKQVTSGRGWPDREMLVVGVLVWILAALIGGLWVGFMWSHWSWKRVAVWWATILLLLPLAVAAAAFLDGLMATSSGPAWEHVLRGWRRAKREMPDGYLLLSIAWSMGVGGMLAGRWLGRRWVGLWRRRMWRNARMRKERSWKRQLLARA